MIGITATVPVEIVFAAGRRPVDLNNLFITSDNPDRLISQAESVGFSHNTCAWIKGIYSAAINNGIHDVIAVTGGDCSNTIALSEVLGRTGMKIFTFEYPLARGSAALWSQMDILRNGLNATWHDIEKAKSMLDRTSGPRAVTGAPRRTSLERSNSTRREKVKPRRRMVSASRRSSPMSGRSSTTSRSVLKTNTTSSLEGWQRSYTLRPAAQKRMTPSMPKR